VHRIRSSKIPGRCLNAPGRTGSLEQATFREALSCSRRPNGNATVTIDHEAWPSAFGEIVLTWSQAPTSTGIQTAYADQVDHGAILSRT
jgi:hypothetical protein